MPLSMKSPGKAASGSGFGGDTGGQRLPIADLHPSGLCAGNRLRHSPAADAAAPGSLRFLVFPDGGVDLAVSQLRRLPGGYPNHLFIRHEFRNYSLGEFFRAVAEAGIFRILEDSWEAFPFFPVSFEKNFGICKNFVCIWGKMGYNSMYQNFELTTKAEKGIPWQKRKPLREL